MYGWENHLKSAIADYNRKLVSGPPMGFAEGGMPSGIIPGPVSMDGGDNTMTPTKGGEYIFPVEAVVGIGKRTASHSQLSDEDALAIGKMILDNEVTGLKSEMGNNTPPRNADIKPAGIGYAEGGMIDTATNWVGSHIIDPAKQALGTLAGSVGIGSKPSAPVAPIQPSGMGTGYLHGAGVASVGHNAAIEQTARESGFAEGGWVDDSPGVSPKPDTHEGITLDPGVSKYIGANQTKETAIKQAMGGTGSLDPSILPAAFQPNLQPSTTGSNTMSGVGIGGKVTMTPSTTDKLATDKAGYLKTPQGVSPGTGIMNVDGKTFDLSGMGPSGGIGVGGASNGVSKSPISFSTDGHIPIHELNGMPVWNKGNGWEAVPDGIKTSKIGTEHHNNMQDVFMAGERDRLKREGITDEGEINRRLNKSWQEQQEHLAGARGAAYKDNQQYQAYDSQNDNRPVYVTGKQLKDNPDRYMPTATTAKALGQTALIEDIRGTVGDTRAAIKNLKTEFTPEARAQMALVFKSRDPSSAWSKFWGGQWASSLTPDQQDYLVKVQLLHENAMAMRSVLGAGQGSEDLRNAIAATIPGASTPSKEFATKQLDSFEKVLNRLERGVPKVELRKDTGATESSASGVGIGGNAGQTDTTPEMQESARLMAKDLHNPSFNSDPEFKKKLYETFKAKGYDHDQIEKIAELAQGMK